MLRDLKNDYALGKAMYPDTIEAALEAMTNCSAPELRKKNTDRGVGFAQSDKPKKVVCWKCGKEGHLKRNCPLLHENENFGESHVQVSEWTM